MAKRGRKERPYEYKALNLEIPADLYRRVFGVAHERGATVTSVIIEALNALVAATEKPEETK